MIYLTPSVESDIEQLTRWINKDPYHRDIVNPIWWLTGALGSCLGFRLDDETGPVAYVRLDEENKDNLLRLHTQFAPREEVEKLRLVRAMYMCIPTVKKFCIQRNASGIVFQSKSEPLIGLMKRKFRFSDFSQDEFIWRVQEG